MVWFITVLRALAACLITNSHYTGVYPSDFLANGGLLGDVIFFAVSGWCLYNVKASFPRWYGKRVVRCYVPVILITAVYMILGFYSFDAHSAVWWYIYPTYYHFIATIIILYIPFYIFMKVDWLKQRIPFLMLLIAGAYIIWYLLGYDKSYYHIDVVEEPMIRFLFMESMLLGALLRQRDEKIRNRLSWTTVIATIVLFVLYFASKILYSRIPALAPFQIMNQLMIFALLYFVLRLLAGMDGVLSRLPGWIRKGIDILAKITLEIYVVQYYLIDSLRNVLPFPLNWICLTAAILCSAAVLHYISHWIIRSIELLATKIMAVAKKKKGINTNT